MIKLSKESQKIAELVILYQETEDDVVFERLIEDINPVVQGCYSKFKSKYDGHVDPDDLQSDLYLGILSAVRGFDPTKGKFEAYLVQRMNGTVIDSFRQRGYGRNQLEKVLKKVDRGAIKEYSEKELRELTGLSKRTISSALFAYGMQHTCSLFNNPEGSTLRYIDMLKDPTNFLEMLLLREEILRLRQTIPNLRDQKVFQLYFIEGYTLLEIGKILDRSESSVCLYIGHIIDKLKSLHEAA